MRLITAIVFVLATGCTTTKAPERPKGEQRVSIMTFNVENLFDTKDDELKNDESFLPLATKNNELYRNKCLAQNLRYKDKGKKTADINPVDEADAQGRTTYYLDECLGKDWTPRIVARKMRRLADVIQQVENGRGPDVLLLQEVENIDVLKEWNDQYLKNSGYKTIQLVEGPDERGIDVAVMSRLETFGEAKLHNIDFSKEPEIDKSDMRPTRGILESHLKLPNGEKLAVFSLHFPSQGASSLHRSAAVKTLMEVMAKAPNDMHKVAGGDFNITSTEEWKKKYFSDVIAKEYAISHKVGCQGCVGTTYYSQDDTWSFYDVLLFSKPLAEGQAAWKLDKASIKIINSSVFQTDYKGKPAKFRTGKGSVGVSDHWPMYAEIFLNPDQKIGAQ